MLLAGLLLGASAWKLDSALEQPLNLTQEQLLDVPAGATPTGTFNRLEADGNLQDAFWLRLYWRFNLEGQPLHSGEYRMTPGMTAQAEWPAYRGNVKSRIYHNSGCKYFNCKACTVPLASPQEAKAKGFRACKVCGG